MSQSDASGETGDAGGPARESAETGSEYVPQPVRTVRRGIDSGAVAAVGAGAALVSGLRALRRGDGRSAFTRIVAGGLLATVAVAQRRSGRGRGRDRAGVEESDVVDTAPDVEDVATEDEGGARRATGEEASEVVDTAPDVESARSDRDVGGSGEAEPGTGAEQGAVDQTDVVDTGVDEGATDDATDETEGVYDASGSATGESDVSVAGPYERLGEAAFDGQSGRVPAPQEAFNLGLLSSGAEVFWGLDESGDYVIVTLEYDTIDEADGFSYVASSEVDDDDRGVRIPDTVQNHWDDVADGGTAVTSGTGIVFVTSDDLREDDLLLVVPEQWIDELVEESEE